LLLKDWLKKNGMSIRAFGRLHGISHVTLCMSFSGKQRLSARTAVKIEHATNGEVSRTESVWPEDFVEKMDDGSEQIKSTHL
jgi:DNA-binding transcriptional regulator YdaS (Cro superfamily)